jgi:hypothetical protein
MSEAVDDSNTRFIARFIPAEKTFPKNFLPLVLNSVKRSYMGKGRNKRTGDKSRKDWVFIGVWVPEAVAAAIDQAAETLDVDRSKFLRESLEEKVRKERTK